MYTTSLNYCAFCEDLDERPHDTSFRGAFCSPCHIDITLELRGCSVFMNPQKSRFDAKQRFISDLPIAHAYFQVSHPRKRALKHSFLCKTERKASQKVKLRPVKSLIHQLWSNPGVGYESRTQGVHAVKLSLTPFLHLERPKRVFQIM